MRAARRLRIISRHEEQVFFNESKLEPPTSKP
jgi:hypothetical protein